MRVTSRKIITRDLSDLGILAQLQADTALVRTVAVGASGALHRGQDYSCAKEGAAEQAQDVVRSVALFEAPLCPTCAPDLMGSLLTAHVHQLLVGLATARAAQRAARSATADRATHRRRLDRARANLTFAARSYPGPAAQVNTEILAAQAAIEGAESMPARREALLTQARTAMLGPVPATARGTVDALFDGSDTLMGIYPTLTASGPTAELITELTVRHQGPRQVLQAPRFVADYLYREMYRTSKFAVIVCASLDGADPEIISAAAAMWDPTSPDPMSNLTTSLRTLTLAAQ